MNKIIVIDNLGRDPEMKYTPNGQGRQPTGALGKGKEHADASQRHHEHDGGDHIA